MRSGSVRRPFWPRAAPSVSYGPPVQVGTSDSFGTWGYPALWYQYDRRTFSAAGRIWAFFSDTSGWNVTSSANGGTTWSSPTQLFAFVNDGEQPGYTDFHFDGTYLHYAYGGDMIGPVASPLRYRRGTPQSNGTISWSAAVQTVTTAWANPREVGVWTDSAGHPFVSFESELNDVRVAWSSTTDGTWSNASGSPAHIDSGDTWWTNIVRLDQSGAMMLFYYHNNSNPLMAAVWDGGSWNTAMELTEFTWFVPPYTNDLATASDPNNGIAWAWWLDSGGGYLREYSGGSWGSVLGPFTFDSFYWSGTERTTFVLAVDGNGVLNIFYASPSATTIGHSTFDGSNWAVPDTIAFPAGDGFLPGALQVSSFSLDGRFVIEYEDQAEHVWAFAVAAPAYTLTTGAGGGPGTYSAAAADSTSVSDAMKALHAQTKTANTTLTTTDAAVGAKSKTGAAADSTSVSDAARGLHATTRNVPDATSISDIAASQRATFRAAGDSAGGSDAVGAVHAQSKTASDSTSVTDTAAGLKGRSGAAGDTGGGSDSAGGVHAQSKNAADTTTTGDAAKGLHATARAVGESTSVSDVAAAGRSTQRAAGDTAGGSDAAGGLHAGLRAAPDAAGGTDAAASSRATARGAADSTSTSDVGTGHIGVRMAAAADTAGVTDAGVGRHSVSRGVADAAGGSDTAAAMGTGQVGANDSAGGSDTASTSHRTTRAAADSAGGSDAVGGLKAGARGAADGAGGSDAVSRLVNVKRAAADSAGGADGAQGTRGLFLTASAVDVAGVVDAVTRTLAVTRRAADSAPAGDVAGTSAGKQGAAGDVAAATDVARAIGLRLVGVADAAPAHDSAGMARRWAVFAADTVPVPADAAELLFGLHGFAADVVSTADMAKATRFRDVPELDGHLSAVLLVETTHTGSTSATLVP